VRRPSLRGNAPIVLVRCVALSVRDGVTIARSGC